MPHAPVNGVDLCYETFGDPDADPLLLVMGLGAQMVAWEVEFCEHLVDRGYHVIRFDNRDVGLSTKFVDVDPTEGLLGAFGGGLAGGGFEPPYRIADMAADAAGLIAHLGHDQVHVVGASMGGMIAQQLTIDHPHRVRTLTSIMSTTGDPDVGGPTPDALTALMEAFTTPTQDRTAAIEVAVRVSRVLAGGGPFDEERAVRRAERSIDRDADQTGTMRQLLAVLGSPSRTEGLREVSAPTLVVHGELDPLVQPSGGERTAEAVPDAELLLVPDMGHDVAPPMWPTLFDALDQLTARVGAP